MKKRKINPLWVLYLLFVFLPIGAVATIIAVALTVPLSFIGDYRWCYMPAKYWARALCRLAFVEVEVKGEENYSPKESYIFVANHQSIYDIFVIYGWLYNKFKWIMKNSLRKLPLIGYTCYKIGHIFIDRSNPIRAKKSIEDATKKLRNGSSIVIFPEGSRSKTGIMGKFRSGAFKIAQEIRLPIVPITIKGTYEVMPSYSYYIKPNKVTLTFHKPIDTTDINNENIDEYIERTRSIILKSL